MISLPSRWIRRVHGWDTSGLARDSSCPLQEAEALHEPPADSPRLWDAREPAEPFTVIDHPGRLPLQEVRPQYRPIRGKQASMDGFCPAVTNQRFSKARAFSSFARIRHH